MKQLSEAGIRALDAIARQHGFSGDAVLHMFEAVMRGEGRMAQFSHQEFGGPGQWMTGGMTMIGDMFNDQLKARVDRLCQSLRTVQTDASNFAAETAATTTPTAVWWPAEFGIPTSSGSQNDSRYAYFGQTQRLVVDSLGKTTIYDTRGHAINGFSQQQSGAPSATFETDAGPIELSRLPVIESATQHKSSTPPHGERSSRSAAEDDILATIQKLADLRATGVVSAEEFEQKKRELLARL